MVENEKICCGSFSSPVGMNNQKTITYKTAFNIDWLINGNNTRYNPKLSKFGITLLGIETGSNMMESGMSSFGFQDIRLGYVGGKEYELDKDDTAAFYICHQSCTIENQMHEVIIVSIVGTISKEQWFSNADVGADSLEYTNATGNHPEWTNTCMHKGFNIAANRCKTKIDEYIKKTVNRNAFIHIFITGHSRGGAIANILGTYYEMDKDMDPYTYTFACPNTTTENNTDYKTIFNIVNTDDIVPTIPFTTWGFHRYGIDLEVSGHELYGKKFEEEIGASISSTGGLTLLKDLSKVVSNRKQLYEFSNSSNNHEPFFKVWTTESSVIEEYYKKEEEFKAEKLNGFIKLHIERDLGYVIEGDYSPIYPIIVILNSTFSDNPISYLAKHPISMNYYNMLIPVMIHFFNGSIISCHMPIIYYYLSDYNFHNTE